MSGVHRMQWTILHNALNVSKPCAMGLCTVWVLRAHGRHICCWDPHCIPMKRTMSREHKRMHQNMIHQCHHLLWRHPHLPIPHGTSVSGPYAELSEIGTRSFRSYKTFALRAEASPWNATKPVKCIIPPSPARRASG